MKHGRSVVAAGALTLAVAGAAAAWGADGHRMIGRAAVAGLPSDMPAFFVDAAEQLTYLGPEPDRWRDDELTAMDEAWKYDHYIDLEAVPAGALDAPDRFAYLAALYAAGIDEPEQSAGLLPYRILELYQRLAAGFARWREADTEAVRGWIQQRIINDAGILGHYVADASNPHHTTIHFNGWADDAPNPEAYTTSRDFHYRFESRFVSAHIDYDRLRTAVPAGADVVDAREAILSFILQTHDQVIPMYELEKTHGFDPDAPSPETQAFVVDRMAAGARMLRSLWYSAWVESEAIAANREEHRAPTDATTASGLQP